MKNDGRNIEEHDASFQAEMADEMSPSPEAKRSIGLFEVHASDHSRSRVIFQALQRVSLLLESNDSVIDDLLHFLKISEALAQNNTSFAELAELSQGDMMVKRAEKLLDERYKRLEAMPPKLRDERFVSILLALYSEEAAGRKVSSKHLYLAAGCPDSTALRCLERLEDANLIERYDAKMDKRITRVKLTPVGEALASKLIQIGF